MTVAADIRQQVFNLLSSASNVSFVTADQESGGLSALAPGQKVSAEVLSTLPNNRVQVQIGGAQFNLDLPMAVRIGQTLEMTFVTSEPRSTFAITRQAGPAPPVALSDASRLLSLLVSDEQALDPSFRSSLRNVSDMLRRSSGETGVLANLMDEALTYSAVSDKSGAAPRQPVDSLPGSALPGNRIQQNAQFAAFEANASQLLRTIAQNSRFVLVEAVNQPASPLPLLPGEEVEGSVVGTLPGGRTFVQVAGTTVEMVLPRTVPNGEILRLTYISSEPKVTFAIPRALPDISSGVLSEAGRWLSVLEHSEGGVSNQQTYVLDRLNTVLKSLPPDSPAFTAILDEAITYQTVIQRQASAGQAETAAIPLMAAPQNPVTAGNGIVLNDDMAKLLQAVIKGNRLALLEALNQQAQPTGLAPGQQLKGEVLAALGGGRFMVQVAGQSMEFILPKGVARGDFINLFFITDEPRQTFLMVRFGRPGDSRVSDTSRWLSGFLSETSGQPTAQAALGILRTLLTEPTTDASLLGQILKQGLRESGLFYESHLARWFGGDYQLEELLKEPQGRLSSRLSSHLPQTNDLQGVPLDGPMQATIKNSSAEVLEAMFYKAGTRVTHEGIADQRVLPIVSEQLSSLQNSQLLFRGDLFPGQNLEWTVAEREAHRDEAGGRERSWETSVTMDLPNLGPVTALLRLDGTNVTIRVKAENETSVPVLETGRARLIEQLEGAGLTPAEMNIGHASS